MRTVSSHGTEGGDVESKERTTKNRDSGDEVYVPYLIHDVMAALLIRGRIAYEVMSRDRG